MTRSCRRRARMNGRILAAALVAGASVWLSDPAARGQDSPAEPSIELRWRDRVGERASETTTRTLTLSFEPTGSSGGAVPDSTRDVTTRTIEVTTLAVGDERPRASRAQVHVREATVGADVGDETRVLVLHDADEIAALRIAHGFPWPVPAVRAGQSWRISEQLARQRFGADGAFAEIDLRYTLESIRRDDESGRAVARVVRELSRIGGGESARLRETSRAVLEFDVEHGRALRFDERVTVRVDSRRFTARGERVVQGRFAYEAVELYDIVPRARTGVTQTERSESVADFVMVARRTSGNGERAALARRIESLHAVERVVREIDASNRPVRVDTFVALSRGYTESSTGGEVVERARTTGPLEGLRLQLALDPERGTRRLLNRDRVRRQIGQQMREEAGASREQEPPTAEQIDARIAEVEAAMSGAHDAFAHMNMPSFAVPVGFVWTLPDDVATAAAAALFSDFAIEDATLTARLEDVRAFGSRPRTAVLSARLQARGALGGQLQATLELPTVLFFDLDEHRPLAVRGEGRLELRGRGAGGVAVGGHGVITSSSLFHYSDGPNIVAEEAEPYADSPLLGRWRYLPDGPRGRTDGRYELTFERTGRCRHVAPHLGTGEPVERHGTWRIERTAEGSRLILAFGQRDRDTFAFDVQTSNDGREVTLQLTKVRDSRWQTGVHPWLPNTSAFYRQAE